MAELKLLGYLICLFLIFFISFRLPKKEVGLSPITNPNALFSSPSSLEKAADFVTVLAILSYLAIAIQLNLQITIKI